jgi:hypothetical protein
VAQKRRRRRRWLIAGAFVLFESVSLRARSGKSAGTVIVRCRAGHLFSTLWIPGASLKSVRLGWWRFQRCPVGRHWTLVTPVKESELSDDELAAARDTHDVRIP